MKPKIEKNKSHLFSIDVDNKLLSHMDKMNPIT